MTDQDTQDAAEILPQGDEPAQDEYQTAMSDAYDRAMARIEEDRNPPADPPKGVAEDKPEDAPADEEANADGEDPDKAAEGDDGDEDKDAAAEDAPKPPTDLPARLKKVWASLDEEAREAVTEGVRKANEKAAQAGQQVKQYEGVKPVHDALVDLAKDIPELSDKPIAEIVEDIKQLAQISASMAKDPLQAIMGVIQQHNLGPAIAQVINGQNPAPQAEVAQTIRTLQHEIQSLRQQVAQYSDPSFIQQNLTTAQTLDVLNDFQHSVDRWNDVEDIMPNIIQRVMAETPDRPARDVLDTAYKRALRAIGAEDDTARPAPATTDPDRAAAAKKASQINVNGSGSGKGRELSEREATMAAYDRAMRA